MKILIFLVFLPLSFFAQNEVERIKIINGYDFNQINQLEKVAYTEDIMQTKLILNYKKEHPSNDSENMYLHKIINGQPIFYTTFNQGSSITISTNKMYPGGSLGLNISGTGMTAGVWDGGKVRDTHIEFGGGKINLSDGATTLSSHSTHVTGTILATGISALRKGIAYGAKAKTYDWNSDYTEMLDFGSQGYLVSNHSYGYVATGLTSAQFGAYDSSSIEIDNVSNTNTYYQIVVAAGNDRDNFTLSQVGDKGGYDLLTGYATAKNDIVVAAVDEVLNYIDPTSVVMSSFSNYGPTDDGRIKPDISAKGVGVNSTTSNSNSSYAIYDGTSMATPSITGMILLLQKHYNNLNPSTYMRASTVRGLICHSAKEAGDNPGPDYGFGWGLANAELAANIITGNNSTSILEEDTLNNGQTFTKQFTVNSAQNITATICWTDPTGVANLSTDIDNRTPRLKNNLDLKILKDGFNYYPWKLNPDAPSDAATNNSDNDVDNIEKVEIPNAQPGVYTIQVSHKGTLSGSSQVFSLIANGSNGLNLNAKDYEFDSSFFVYPNPAKSTLFYTNKNSVELTSISIYDISGKEVYRSSNLIPTSIDVSNYSSGVYFVNFKTNSSSTTKKFIKE